MFYLDWEFDLYRCFNLPLRFGNLFELKRMDFVCEECNLCTQQAFRDWGSFYKAHDIIGGVRGALLEGGTLEQGVAGKDNRRAMASLMEAYLGGFV